MFFTESNLYVEDLAQNGLISFTGFYVVFNLLLLIFVFLSYLLVLPWSVDWGIGLIGFMKFSTVILFILVLMQFNRTEVVDCFKVIPWSGCAMVILTGMTYFIPDLAGYFIDAGRLGGFFQYANTFALAYLIDDKPNLDLTDRERIYLTELKKVMDQMPPQW